jgi:hypothetical protein
MGSFWERMLQPQIFAILLQRFGGTELVNRSRHVVAEDRQRQCIWVRRDAYEALGRSMPR